jgi:uncharacterized protein GlcG (DUF336 family)
MDAGGRNAARWAARVRRGPPEKEAGVSKRTWAAITVLQTGLVALALVLVTTRTGSAAPGASDAAQAAPASVAEQTTSQQPNLRFEPTITLREARAIVDAAKLKAAELRGTITVAVIDAGGNLVSLDRMDGRGPTWDKFAIGKAQGALARRRPTAEFRDLLTERPDIFFGMQTMMAGQYYMVNGGVPLAIDGVIVGAAGAGGLGLGEDDIAVEAGIAAWQQLRQSMGR